ncbi:MATE family efflux transporter [Pseudaeromonas paramecii]|uniref:Multidrug-efflux transporter n=1 Tax=Pseudaeromonas paramecii TaxID=2138166 RepID=A0ABP8QJZ3_9GAMM
MSYSRILAYVGEIRHLIRLALPILLAQVAQIAMTFVDTLMAGQVSAVDLAAVSIASSFWLPIILFSQGLLMAVTPMVAQLNGARRAGDIPALISQGLWLSLLISPPALLLLYLSPWLLPWMEVDAALADKTAGYLHAIAWGLPAYLIYQVLRNYTEGLSFTAPTMFIGFIGLLVNIPANYVLIYGKLGLPALGAVGCGVASAIVFWAMALAMWLFVRRSPRYDHCRLFQQWTRPQWSTLRRLIQLGLPLGLATFCEVTMFALIAILLASLGAELVASHQIALNFSSLVFMLPLSLGFAASIRVGHALGEEEPTRARLATLATLILGLFLALLTATLTWQGRHWIASRYTDDAMVIALAAHLLIFAAIYQFSDTVQVVCSGALRGYKDTKMIFVITMAAYWGVGLPLGVVLGMTDWLRPAMGPEGFWIGLISGLTCSALLFSWRLKVIFNKYSEL